MTEINLLGDAGDKKYKNTDRNKEKVPVEYTDPTKQISTIHKQTWREFFRKMFPKKKPGMKMVKIEKFEPQPKKPEKKESLFHFRKHTKVHIDDADVVIPPPLQKNKPIARIIKVSHEEVVQPKKEVFIEKKKEVFLPKEVPVFKNPNPLKEYKIPEKQKPVFSDIKKAPETNRVSAPHKKEIEYTVPKEKENHSRMNIPNFDVNLVPKDFISNLTPQSYFKRLGWVALVSIIVVIIAYMGIALYEYNLKGKTKDNNAEMLAVQKEINTYLALQQDTNILKERIDGVQEILNKHVYWSAFLDTLQQSTLDSVYYESITGDVSGNFKIAAFASSFEAMAEQLRVFESADFVEEVTITGGTKITEVNAEGLEVVGENSKVEFSVTLKVDPDIFTLE